VENRFVLDLLVAAVGQLVPGRAYRVVHADTADARGIDVAFLYDPALFEVPDGETFFHVVMRRNATREIVQVNFRTQAGRTWSVFGNHWPSRSGGQLESAGYRDIAGETLAYFHQRALEVHGEGTPVLAMGDFNDEPFDTSLVTHALSTRQRTKVLRAEIPRLWNLMWPPMGTPDGTPSTSTTSPTNWTSSWSTRTWPPTTHPSKSSRTPHRSCSSTTPSPPAASTAGPGPSAGWATPSTRTATPTTSPSASKSPKPTDGN
jgi:hypothetical protein